MKTGKKLLLASAAFLALGVSESAMAETITTKTVVSQKALPHVTETNFAAFDLNGDNVLSMREVGSKLFYIFDTDGNEVIDNIEINNKQVMTIIPMEKTTITAIDFNNDGLADDTAFSHENFIQQSRLMKFDKNMDGLTAAEFIGNSFLELDDNNDKAITLDEWKEAYIASLAPKAAEQERYN